MQDQLETVQPLQGVETASPAFKAFLDLESMDVLYRDLRRSCVSDLL